MVSIGDTVTRRMILGVEAAASRESYTGTVIYVHPWAGWYCVRFDFPHGSVRECFWLEEKDRPAMREEKRKQRVYEERRKREGKRTSF